MQAIIKTLHFLLVKESLKTSVSFEARKGTWSALSSIALMHSFSAKRLQIIESLPFVDFSSLNSPLSIITLGILRSLAPCQVHQYQLAHNTLS